MDISNEMPKSHIRFILIQNKSVIFHVYFVLFFVCLYICVCKCLLQNNNHKSKHRNNTTSKQHSLYVRGPLRQCRSIWSGASGLPYYCAPLVCVSDVMELLSVLRHNKPETKKLCARARDCGALTVVACAHCPLEPHLISQLPVVAKSCSNPRTHKADPLPARVTG